MRGIVLYGPPASGKSTITNKLTSMNPRFQLFRRLKAGHGRRAEYRMTTHADLQQIRDRGELIWENSIYGSTYAVDQEELSRLLKAGLLPVVHLGQPDAVRALLSRTSLSWLVVSLTCPRAVAMARIAARATGDDSARKVAWDETPPLPDADLEVNTATSTLRATTMQIVSVHRSMTNRQCAAANRS